jgi:O-antigen/teichoic acid export membrane protein
LLQSTLVRAAGVYGIANILRQGLPVFLVPLLTRYLSEQDYGTTAVFAALASVLTPIIGLNSGGAMQRKYFDREEVDFPAYIFNCMLIVVVSLAGVWAIMQLFQGPIAAVSEVAPSWFWAAIVLATAQVVITSLLGLLQAQNRAVLYAVIQVGRSLVIAGLTVLLVVGLGQDWRGSIMAQVIGGVGFTLLSLVILLREGWVRPRIDKAYIQHALAYGLPLVPHLLSSVAVQTIDRLFVTHYEGLAQTGLYSLGYQLGAVIGLIEDSFNRAFQPWVYVQLKQGGPDTKRRLVLLTYGYFVAILVLAVGLGVVAPLVLGVLVPERFRGASVHVLWIALGFAFSGMYKMVSTYLFYAERTGVLAWMTMIQAALNILLNWWLVPRFGAVGSAYATTASFFVYFVLCWIAAARVFPMPWSLRRGTELD